MRSPELLTPKKAEGFLCQRMEITSPAFPEFAHIPENYSAEGKNINPELLIEKIPTGTKSLAIIVDDPDAPVGTWVHWIAWNIPVSRRIKQNSVPGIEGVNDFGKHHYCGPCPPSGTHRYFFKLYALDTLLDISPRSKKLDLQKAMTGHILGYGELIGSFAHHKTSQ